MGFKDFFFDEDDKAKTPVSTEPVRRPMGTSTYAPSGANSFTQQPQNNFLQSNNNMFNPGPPVVTVAEDRHIAHVADIMLKLNANRSDFFQFMKIAKKMSATVTGPQLWLNAFAAYNALNEDATADTLTISAAEYTKALQADATTVSNRHDGKFTDPNSAIGTQSGLQAGLSAEIGQLEKTLSEKREQLNIASNALATETQKAGASFASYTIASHAALNEIALFEQNINTYLTPKLSL